MTPFYPFSGATRTPAFDHGNDDFASFIIGIPNAIHHSNETNFIILLLNRFDPLTMLTTVVLTVTGLVFCRHVH